MKIENCKLHSKGILRSRQISRGFTMIELLIVIAVLGILAVAVLSAINPLEQINRGRDTGSRSDTEQTLNAVERFYTIQQYFPWQTGVADTTDKIDWVSLTTATGEATDEIVDILAQAGTQEIKQSFADRLKNIKYELFIYKKEGIANSPYVCFEPKSASFQTEAKTRCTGTKPGDWPASACNNSTDCGTTPNNNCICLP